MSNHPAMTTCEVCGAAVKELRRGRCWGCYSRWAEMRPVGLGASCVVCGDRRRRNLKSIELLGAWLPCCHNCASCAGQLSPMPRSIAGVRRALSRERRGGERRIGLDDQRAFRMNRRTGERRRVRDGVGMAAMATNEVDEIFASVDDDMIVEISDLDEDLFGGPSEPGELTQIIELVAEPA